MNTMRRLVLLVGLCFVVTGCSVHRQVFLPGEAASTAPDCAPMPPVKVGMQARVLLRSGQERDGEVLEVSEDAVVLGKVGNYGLERTVIPAGDIISIEIEEPTGFTSAATNVVIFCAAVVTVLLIAVTTSLEWGYN